MIRKSLRIGWGSTAGPLLVDGPFSHRLANLLIALRYFRNTQRYVRSAGYAPNYVNPVCFSEKMQHRKLFDRNPLFKVLCDKLEARAYAEKADCGLKFPQLYWSGDDPNAIPFDDLPEPYIVKSNHGSGRQHVVRDKRRVDETKIRSDCRRWLRRSFGRGRGEWGYRDIPRRIYVEELLSAPAGQLFPDDFKLVTIGGRVAWIEHIHDRGQAHNKTYFDRHWNRIKFRRWQGIPDPLRRPTEGALRPAALGRMVEIAERLAAGIDQLRVDLYELGGEVYFGEFTIYEESGMGIAYPEDEVFANFPSRNLDREIGAKWLIPPVSVSEKLACVLFGTTPTRQVHE